MNVAPIGSIIGGGGRGEVPPSASGAVGGVWSDEKPPQEPDIAAAFRSGIGMAVRSAWMTVDQADVDTFAAVTRDANPLHVDPVAAAAGPFGAPIAHGFLVLSLLSAFVNEMTGIPSGAKAAVNRGFNRVRFLSPVRVGSRIRGRMTTREVRAAGATRFIIRATVAVEIENTAQPALVADWEFIIYP